MNGTHAGYGSCTPLTPEANFAATASRARHGHGTRTRFPRLSITFSQESYPAAWSGNGAQEQQQEDTAPKHTLTPEATFATTASRALHGHGHGTRCLPTRCRGGHGCARQVIQSYDRPDPRQPASRQKKVAGKVVHPTGFQQKPEWCGNRKSNGIQGRRSPLRCKWSTR